MALDNPEWLKGFLVTNARQLGMAGRILFPIPDRGLLTALSHQGEDDPDLGRQRRLIVPAYAHAFKKAIPGSELVAIPEAGHMVTLEKTDQVMAAIARLG